MQCLGQVMACVTDIHCRFLCQYRGCLQTALQIHVVTSHHCPKQCAYSCLVYAPQFLFCGKNGRRDIKRSGLALRLQQNEAGMHRLTGNLEAQV